MTLWTFFFSSWRKKADSKSVNIASFAALTEEDIDIIRQRGLILFSMSFSLHVLSFFCFFLFFIRNTRDRGDSVNFLLLVTRMSELSKKYDYPLLIVPALSRFFKYDISSTRQIIILKILFETQKSNTVSIFV